MMLPLGVIMVWNRLAIEVTDEVSRPAPAAALKLRLRHRTRPDERTPQFSPGCHTHLTADAWTAAARGT